MCNIEVAYHMNNYEFYNEIMELLSRGREGPYWDYKSDYPDYPEDKLKDIICMANNLENRDAYLIYGANNDGSICGIENTRMSRISSAGLAEFLRTKPFAILPTNRCKDHKYRGTST